MSTGYGWEGRPVRQVCATLLGARHVPEELSLTVLAQQNWGGGQCPQAMMVSCLNIGANAAARRGPDPPPSSKMTYT